MKTEIRIRRVDNGYIVSRSTNIVDEWKDVAIACGPHDLCDVIRSIFSDPPLCAEVSEEEGFEIKGNPKAVFYGTAKANKPLSARWL